MSSHVPSILENMHGGWSRHMMHSIAHKVDGVQVAHPPSDLSNGGNSQHVSGSQHLSGSVHLSGRVSPFRKPQSAQKALKPTAFQDMLRRQLAQVPESAEQQEVAETSGGQEGFSSSMYLVPAECASYCNIRTILKCKMCKSSG